MEKVGRMEESMEQFFISEIKIGKVRHLKNIAIPLAKDTRKHLILTGCNGSGKTSVLEVLKNSLDATATTEEAEEIARAKRLMKSCESQLKQMKESEKKSSKAVEIERDYRNWEKELMELQGGLLLEFNQPLSKVGYSFYRGQFVLGYYEAERSFQAIVPKHIEKVELKDHYTMWETPQQEFVKYLVDRQVTAALARNKGDIQKADEINSWFIKFEALLQKIFDDESLQLIFDEDTYNFTIKEKNREPFDFNTMSSGFSAVLDIVLDLILRMEKTTNRSFVFDVPGIVLIDEIETHLHLEMQKNILGILTTVFPNIQFIVSTHSPFVLNSREDVVIYDLEKRILVEGGLTNLPYSGIVEGYFRADELSYELKEKFDRFRELVGKKELSDDELEEIGDLEMYLDEIPDYLALNITTEYQRLKLEYEKREESGW